MKSLPVHSPNVAFANNIGVDPTFSGPDKGENNTGRLRRGRGIVSLPEFMNFKLFGKTILVVIIKFELFWAIHSASENPKRALVSAFPSLILLFTYLKRGPSPIWLTKPGSHRLRLEQSSSQGFTWACFARHFFGIPGKKNTNVLGMRRCMPSTARKAYQTGQALEMMDFERRSE